MKILIRIGFDICGFLLFTLLASYALGILFYPLYKSKITAKFFIVYNSCLLGLVVILFTIAFFHILTNNTLTVWGFGTPTLLVGTVDITVGVGFTPINITFAYLVSIIGSATNLYVLNYFKNEADEMAFAGWLNAFIASMLLLVLSINFYTLFLGWELIGLTSFFLINFWQGRRGVLKSSFKAFCFNLVSDIFLLTALVCFYWCVGTTECDIFIYAVVFDGLSSSPTLTLGLVSLTICAGIKSVQIGGHLWLPDSMEAPVPASALIHSATLVSAGIYLISKFNLLYLLQGWTRILIIIGSVTALYGGVVSASQTDMKKLLAYSTMSHCGFLWVLASTGHMFMTAFYLFFHGLFKAATFFCAGTFIRMYGSQDTRVMGGGHRFLPFDSLLLIICAANLSGLPLMAGYLYKYYFVKVLLGSIVGWCVLGNLFIAMASSLVYFFRLTFYVVFDFYKNARAPLYFLLINKRLFLDNLKLSAVNQSLGLFILFFFAFWTGLFFCWFHGLVPVVDEASFGISRTYEEVLEVGVIYFMQYFYFYFLYFLILVSSIIISWRRSVTGVEVLVALLFCIFIVLL